MSEAVFDFHEGRTPLLVSVPHDGRLLPDDIASRMSAAGRALPDTDWHVARLYAFARELGASVIVARYSRYVVDLNRPADDGALYTEQMATGLCPEQTFAGEAIYQPGERLHGDERQRRITQFWRPYHERLGMALAALRSTFGYALLWDAHSIVSQVPALFSGELPVLNLGTWNGCSCAAAIERALTRAVRASALPSVINGRFTGGYITRHYGDPAQRVHAVQLELAQRSYMDERSLQYDDAQSARLIPVLHELLQTYTDAAERLPR